MPTASKKTISGKILIVDDNDNGLLARRSVLQELGHEIVTSTTPEQALKLCISQKFDLIVTDFKMPHMNGIEFIKKVRASVGSMPVILLSGFTDTLGLTQENTGADAVIQKSSYEVTHLIREVNRLLMPRKGPASESGSTVKKKLKS